MIASSVADARSASTGIAVETTAPTWTSVTVSRIVIMPGLDDCFGFFQVRRGEARDRPATLNRRDRTCIRIPRPTRIPRRTPHPWLVCPQSLTPAHSPRAAGDARYIHDGPYSIPETAPTGETVWRNADEPTLADTPYAGCHTVYDVFEFAIARNGGRPAMGERAIERSEMVEGFEKLTLSEYK